MVVLFTSGNIQHLFIIMNKHQQIIITIFFSYYCGNQKHYRANLSLAQRVYKPSIRQEIADESDGGVKVVSEMKLTNRCFNFFVKIFLKENKISGLNIVLHLTPKVSVL